MARPKAPIIAEVSASSQTQVLSLVREVRTLRAYWEQQAAATVPPEHGNVSLREQDVLILLLCGFFEPTVRSLRTIEQLAQVPSVQQHLQVTHVPKSTLADALARFRVGQLRPLVRQLQRQVPHLRRVDPDLERVAGQVLAGDGSMFRLAGEVAWAMQRRKNASGAVDSQVKLNLLVDVQRWTMEDFCVTGGAHRGGEPAAMQPMLRPGVLYLFDRAYYPFHFINAVLDAGADLVVRLKKDIPFRADDNASSRALSAKDHAAQVRDDQVGWLGVADGCKAKAPPQPMRLVSIWDEQRQEVVRLLTNRLDLAAWEVGHLYRCRWIIELFFRWLKVNVGFCHLLSTSANGITLQFYVAMICTLLIHVRTGLPVDRYSLLALGLVAGGRCRYEDQLPVLLKRQRERLRAQQRRAERKLQQQAAGLQKPMAQLPG